MNTQKLPTLREELDRLDNINVWYGKPVVIIRSSDGHVLSEHYEPYWAKRAYQKSRRRLTAKTSFVGGTAFVYV